MKFQQFASPMQSGQTQHTYEAVKLVEHQQHLPESFFQLSSFFGHLVGIASYEALPSQAQLVEEIPYQILLVH